MQKRKVLIIQTAFIGDVILTLPLIQILYANEYLVDILCIPAVEELVKGRKDINEVIVYDKHNTEKGEHKLIKIVNHIRRNKYDIVISPHRYSRSTLIAFFSGAHIRIGFDNSSLKFLYSNLEKYNSEIHEIQRNLSLLSSIGLSYTKIVRPELAITNDHKSKIDMLLEGRGDKRLIGIAPGSVWFTKRFPKEKFVNVVNSIDENYIIILIGGRNDADICSFIQNNSQHKNILNASGKLSLLESAELIRRCGVLLTNDSAPLHIANSVETKTAAIFGNTVPEFGFYPYGKHDAVIQKQGLPCKPCSIHGLEKCPIGTFPCMLELDEKVIADTICRMIS